MAPNVLEDKRKISRKQKCSIRPGSFWLVVWQEFWNTCPGLGSPGRFSLVAVYHSPVKGMGYGDSQKGELTPRLGVTGAHLGTDVNFRLKWRRD